MVARTKSYLQYITDSVFKGELQTKWEPGGDIGHILSDSEDVMVFLDL